ncbi:MAG: hypothetical protein WC547_09585 [Candidatus Omnitrophota bacterium]
MDPATMMAAASVAQKVVSPSSGGPAAAQPTSTSLNIDAAARSQAQSGDISGDFQSGSFTVGGSSSNWVYIAIIAGAVIVAAMFIFKGKARR